MEQFEATWERIKDEDDPRRCQYIKPTAGQCQNVCVEGSSYCPAHGGNKAFDAKKKESLRNYRLTKFHQKIQELGNSDFIYSLRDEVGLLRLMIQEKINHCDDEADLLLISGPLSDLLMKSDKLVNSCHRLETKLGNHLDRTRVVGLAQTIVQIIGKHVTDESLLEKISGEIAEALNPE